MWNLKLLLLIFQGHLVVGDENISTYDDGFWLKCVSSLYDLTISSTATDALRLLLLDGAPNKFHSYSISRAGGLARDPLLKPGLPTAIFMHGFQDGGGSKKMATPFYIEKGGYNTIIVDGTTILVGEYMRCSRLTHHIGKRLGIVLAQLFMSGFRVDKLEVYGHSLGAHIAGFMAKTFRKLTGKTLPFITGLDPAGPCFRNASIEDRIDRSDADFVQIIHTNSGGYGLRTTIGHVDFYVNGGKKQLLEMALPCGNICSHVIALDYWLVSLKYPRGFIGVECASMEEVDAGWCQGKDRKTAVMGVYADRKTRGVYYVKTIGKRPFIMGMNGVYAINPLLKKT